MATDSALSDLFSDLRKHSNGELRSDLLTKTLYSTDASIYQKMPLGVYFPENTDDLAAACELANHYQIPILARTGGSSLAGQAVNEALLMDLSRHMNRILEVNAEEHWVRVQPGVVLDQLNLHLASVGLKFGPDPASSNRAAMGGIVSNNSTGAHSILYGMTADHVLEIKGFLDDGSPFHFRTLDDDQSRFQRKQSGRQADILRNLHLLVRDKTNYETILRGTPHHWRRCGGYNLDRLIGEGPTFRVPQDHRFNPAQLISGAEGTLAIISEIKLNLVPLPKTTALALVHFDSLREALEAVPRILETAPAAIELLDNLGLTLCREVPAYARLLKTFISGSPNCLLITEFYGESQTHLADQVYHLKNLLKQGSKKIQITTAVDPQLQQNVWTVRKVGLGLLMSIKGDHKPIPFIEDAAVPPEHLADYISRLEKFCNDLGTRVAYYAHASAGCLHVRPLINNKVATDIRKLPQIARFSAELVGEYGGALSSEHGDGRCRSWLNPIFYGKDLYQLFTRVKKIFDPANRLNPGIIVNSQDMVQDLRYGESYHMKLPQTFLNFDDEQGFGRAIEMCNGAGVCRKLTTGAMCPSFMATRKEEDSTRGRANALRAALSGQLEPGALTGKELYQVMDLCVSCKACKAECPSSVDMARIKTEFLAQYHQHHGLPLRSRLFGNIHRLARWNSGPLAPALNKLLKSRPVRMLLRSAGIAPQRSLPEFARKPFTNWFREKPAQKYGSEKTVILFHDTFNTYHDPHIAIAATEVLEALGYRVHLSQHGCCGRPLISKGMVKEATRLAGQTVSALTKFAEKGVPIIGLEPSCLLTLRDEYHYLLAGNTAVETVAQQSMLFEEFLAAEVSGGSLSAQSTDAGEVLVHTHCHQKALTGSMPTIVILQAAGYRVREIDSSCCGMAGSFGYEAEHYDISMQMAERRILPAIREAAEEVLIVAGGSSCRHQLAHGSHRQILHPVEALHRVYCPAESD